jgi:transcriptional repressor NrdR
MRCPFCGKNNEDQVIDSREGADGEFVRRRRECTSCKHRFTTYERIDEIPIMVVKKDGRREPFDRQKILTGLLSACEKRPISPAKIESIVNAIEKFVHESPDRECPTKKIGDIVMKKLKDTDQVAYVRFASVYREFNDVSEFMNELKGMVKPRTK